MFRRRAPSRRPAPAQNRIARFEPLEMRAMLTTGLTGGDQPHDNYAPSLGVNYIIALEGIYPARRDVGDPRGSATNDVMIGEVRPWADSFAPLGWAFADGQLVPLAQNTALFSLLGTTYGGNGTSNFALPDLRGRTAIGAGQGPGLTDRPLGSVVGEATVTLTEDQLPPHQHTLPGDISGTTGGGQSHNNMQPSLALNFIISTGSEGGFTPGEIRLFAGNFEPLGWDFADGELLSTTEEDDLYAYLGTTYGGNGSTTFALPDLRGRFATNFGDRADDYQLGEAFGVETVTLTTAQIPSHTHTIPSGVTGATGGGQPHQNVQPGLAINYVMASEGIYPGPNSGGFGRDFYTLSEVKMYAHNSSTLEDHRLLHMNGQELVLSQNTALFSLLGTVYGGNGTTRFAIPDMRSRVAAQQIQDPATTGREYGAVWGSATVALTVDQLPSHSHTTIPRNDPPAGTDGTVSTLEDTPYIFAPADFGFSDPIDLPPHQLLAVRIATLPAGGTLTNNGSPVTAGSSVSATDIAAGRLRFTPAANASGDDYASFTFQVQDNGGTADGGVDLDPTPNTLTIDVLAVDYDFGDAPNSYGTTLASDGARHLEGSSLWLGAGVDQELDGQPNAAASGDDLAGSDDENGVQIAAGLLTGSAARITVNASAAARLDAWIDYNRNGTFDMDEKIASNLSVSAGANTLDINVPATAIAGASYARFRLSSTGGLGPTGVAADGEVEDYAVTLAAPTTGQIALVGDPLNPGSNLLLVNGTAGPDAIIIRPAPGNPLLIEVVMSPPYVTQAFPRSAVQRIHVNGNAASDSIVIDPSLTIPATLDGGAGNDAIAAGSGSSILLGGLGNDSLSGGSARDLIIGGAGLDVILGGGNDDILIGGNLAQANNLASLSALQASWNSAATFSSRTAALAASLSAANVQDDGVADYIYGQAGRDWLLDFALRDYFFDYDANPLTGDRKN